MMSQTRKARHRKRQQPLPQCLWAVEEQRGRSTAWPGCLGEIFDHSIPWRAQVHCSMWQHLCAGSFLQLNFVFLLFSLHCSPGCPSLLHWVLAGLCHDISEFLSSSKESLHTWWYLQSISSRNRGNGKWGQGILAGKNRNCISLALLGTKKMI